MSDESSIPPTPHPGSSVGNPWKIFGIAMAVVALVCAALTVGYIVGTSDVGESSTEVEVMTSSTATAAPVEATVPPTPTAAPVEMTAAPTTTRPATISQAELNYRALFESWATDVPDLYQLLGGDWETFRSESGDMRLGKWIGELGLVEAQLCNSLRANDATFDYGRQSFGPEDNFLGTGIDLTAEQFDKVARQLIYNRCRDRLG